TQGWKCGYWDRAPDGMTVPCQTSSLQETGLMQTFPGDKGDSRLICLTTQGPSCLDTVQG
ncbi:hypothetical protein XENOCAPTIV_018186, partial [Xenoophorus captivus]